VATDANDQREESQPSDAADGGDGDLALIEFLADRDVACPLCQYNLRGLRSSRCPECGRELRLTVGLTEPPLKAWIVVAACTWLAAGVGVLFVVAILRAGFPPRRMAVSVTIFVASIPLAIFTTVRRRAFQRLGNSTQSAIAATAVVVTVAAFAFLVATFH
jgi:hypothetical protein